ncbi:hypothetical protein M514_04221 [Trichuris suis]|uniref:Uncharacterized protein n=1 Tax=Trichuris suis TaxID=68888 RepID=A0A085MC41_9BILA|nr:hypothetical protein M513_04221 [Trichuris suis]KFD71662.1 hypothetical protein M514_04221 [Trichuris suis]
MALMTNALEAPAHGKAKANLEYSSTTHRRYLLEESPGTGPLKSKFSRSNGCVALTRSVECRLPLSTNLAVIHNLSEFFYRIGDGKCSSARLVLTEVFADLMKENDCSRTYVEPNIAIILDANLLKLLNFSGSYYGFAQPFNDKDCSPLWSGKRSRQHRAIPYC